MLRAADIYKSYGGLKVLKGVNLHVSKGEIVSIVGASGAGKTTMLHILGTLDHADSGSLYINNTAINVNTMSDKSLSSFRNQNIGFIFQFHNLLPEFTALENVCLPAYIMGKTEHSVQKKAGDILNILGMGHRTDHKPAQLSGGEQQRVAIARALINDPAIIFADEPSGNLDSQNAEELHKLFFKLRNELNQTFVIVTHNASLAAISDRKIEMKDGVIV